MDVLLLYVDEIGLLLNEDFGHMSFRLAVSDLCLTF